MFNYNREGFLISHEAGVKELEAARRQLPHHLRKDAFGEARTWLVTRAIAPGADVVFRVTGVLRAKGGRYWRRSTSRALGLITNGFSQVREYLPGWPSMA